MKDKTLIVVISDTHNSYSSMDKVKEMINTAEVLIHLGDNIKDVKYLTEDFHGEVYSVKGNCDFVECGLKEQVVEVRGKRFFITHGDRYGVKQGFTSIYFKGKELGVDGVLFGHTHQKIVSEENGLWIINPGSPALPKDGSRSIAFIEISDENGIYPYIRTF